MKTRFLKPSEVRRSWFLVDAAGKTLGRLASEIAKRLRGKHKPEWTPHIDCGDYIVVINAEKVRVTGRKELEKLYRFQRSQRPGGLKEIPLWKMREEHPERLIEHAVKGMLPKNRLGRAMFKKLKVYRGAHHPHQAQQPKLLDL